MASLIPNVLEGCDGFSAFFWSPRVEISPVLFPIGGFIKRSAGVALSHDNKSEVFTFVFPRDVRARRLLPLTHVIRHTVPAAVIPHRLFVGTISEWEHLFLRDKHHCSITQRSYACTACSQYNVGLSVIKWRNWIHKSAANLSQTPS